MSNSNSGVRTVFKIIAFIAVVALILSISRIPLSATDRDSVPLYYAYNLAIVSQMYAFLAAIAVAIVCIAIGALTYKHYDVIGVPLVAGGLATLIVLTVMAYFIQAFGKHIIGENAQTAELVLTIVIGIEWIMLVAYAWKVYPADDKISSSPPAHHSEGLPPTPSTNNSPYPPVGAQRY